MMQSGTILNVADKTCVVLGRCLRVFGGKRLAILGDIVLLSVEWLDIKKYYRLKPRWQKFFSLGTMHRALVVRGKVNYCRFPGNFIKFDDNAVLLVTRRIIPVSSRAVGPLLKEFCIKWPSFGCISRCLV